MTESSSDRAIAIVGVGAILPDAPDVLSFWTNLKEGRYSISDVTDRWDEGLYYDADPKAPDKTYSKIGGWVRDYEWDPMKWRMPIPPKVGEVMDPAQKWAVAASREALLDFGYPERPIDRERTAVIMGNALGGDFHLRSAARILFPEVGDELTKAPSFQALPEDVRSAVMEELVAGVRTRIPNITEDTMPGELGNIVAGRVAALYDFKGPNYIADAACASAMAAMSAAAEGLRQNEYDAVLTGGIDANMSASTFVKFSKIGALSATGTRPYAAGADGFVMGEGAAVFLLKRLEDAERDGDKIYAVMLGTGGSSDGKGKGITAPNPVGQRFAVERAWKRAGVEPTVGDMVEGHGTSTKVGDVVEVESLGEVFREAGLPVGSLPLGSVKSNIGHLKGAAGAAGFLKATLALHHKMLPPSVNFDTPNPNIDFTASPFRVNTELRSWEKPGSNGDTIRRAGVSAFGFGGTNFHVVLEEHVPGRHRPRRAQVQGAELATPGVRRSPAKAPLRGALVVGGVDDPEVAVKLREIAKRAAEGNAPPPAPPRRVDLDAPVRIAIDYGDAAELVERCAMAVKALGNGDDRRFRALRNKGVFLGRGAPGKVAFLFTGQGSQYVGMLGELRDREPLVEATFAEADQVMTPLLGGPLTERIFVNSDDPEALAQAEAELKQTAVTQPAVLTVDTALARLFGAYGIEPDFVMGHSLGEYGALVAAGGMPFGDALTAVAARGDAMTRLALEDNGLMAAVFGPVEEVTRLVESVDGYVVVANVNSTKECVIGGATEAVQSAMEQLKEAGYRNVQLPVSHAFHTRIVEPAAEPLRDVLRGLQLTAPRIPVVANVDASFYPTGPDASEEMIEILGLQIGSPVQFVKGLNALYGAGARVFVEMGPKRALYGMADDVVGGRDGVTVLFTNHPRTPDLVAMNRTLCGLYALGLGDSSKDMVEMPEQTTPATVAADVPAVTATPQSPPEATTAARRGEEDRYVTLGRMFADFMDKSFDVYSGGRRETAPVRVGITGAALGLPGTEKVFDDGNLERILQGEGFIKPVSEELRDKVLDRRITRLVKGPNGEARFETVTDPEEVIKLAGRAGEFDLSGEFGYPEDRVTALDRVTHLAIAAGIDALRDAGIPLVRRYKETTTGSKLPTGWSLPEEMWDDTGVIFGSAFPGYDQLIQILEEYHEDRSRRVRLEELKALQFVVVDGPGKSQLAWRIAQLEEELGEEPYQFDRRFLFQVLNMGHSQFAEYIGARGPNTGINGACATGTQGVAIAQDWVQNGRCRRVIVVTGDDVNTDDMFPWFASGFVAAGVAATDAKVEDAALPFDRRRHGLIMGMGGSALVVEDLAAAAERGVGPICEILGSVVANSAYHGSRLDVPHIVGVMEKLVSEVEAQWGIDRNEIAPETVFVSHETYTPARGGSASAEVHALREVFGEHTDSIVVANTKGYTGHAMGVAIEDTLAVKILETGIVPPVANYREVDPELGTLNLSKGGSYPVQYALRLAAGFGSQICMSLCRWTPPPDGARRAPDDLGFQHRVADPAVWETWLRRVTGYEAPELEIVQRTLRLKDHGPPMPALVAPEPAAVVAAPPPVMPASPVVAAPTPTVVQPDAEPADEPEATPETVPDAAPLEPALRSPAGEGEGAVSAPQDPVAQKVLAIVAEQTGYPPDMLALDLDLEADLGIDTVKQAEMFAAIRGAYDIERDDNLALRDYPTLARAIEFVYEKRPDLVASTATGRAPEAAPQEPALPSPDGAEGSAEGAPQDAVTIKVLEIVAEQTGYPTDMLELDLDLEADLGIDTVKQAEMFAAIRGAYDIERDDNLALRDYPTLARAIEFVYEKRPDLVGAAGAAAAGVAPVVDAAGELVLDLRDLAPATEPAAGTVEPAPAIPDAEGAPDTAPQETTLRSPVGAGGAAEGAPQDPVAQKVLEIVSEQTGYPPDMLELDLDLEADLGIDTVKQAEMFAAIREAYGIERDDDLALRDYPTLARAIEFVYEKRPDLSTSGPPAEEPAEAQPDGTEPAETEPAAAAVEHAAEASGPGGARMRWRGSMEAAQSVPRRVPVARLRPVMERFPESGVTLGPDARVVVVPDEGGVGIALAERLRKQGVDVLVADPSLDTDHLVADVMDWRADGIVTGLYWLPAMDAVLAPELADPEDRQEAFRRRVKALHALARALYDDLEGAGRFLVSGVRLGGRHGYEPEGATDDAGGAVTGFTKAFARERPEALVKAVDFETSRKTAKLAAVLIAETLRDPAVVEVGHAEGRRWTVGLEEQPVEPGEPLGQESVYLVTGAAGSIVSAILTDLSQDGGTFWLLDLADEPDEEDSDLDRVRSDRDGLRRDIFARMQAEGERVTPVQVEKELAALEREEAARAAMRAIRTAGGTVHYRSLDLMDSEAVSGVVREIVTEHGRVDVLIHAAGLEISRSLPDKSEEEFARVFDVKVEGWYNLLTALGDTPLGSVMTFSSIAGRFGNAGQTDYAAANDLLCKAVSSLRRTRPETRAMSLDWTAWGEIGMAARGSIPTIMRAAGIDMLSPAAGIAIVRRELTARTQGEAVIAQGLGIMLSESSDEARFDPRFHDSSVAAAGPMVERVRSVSLFDGMVVERELDPRAQPFLDHHRIDGTAVLPGVMGLEAMAEAASLPFPNLRVAALEDVQFHAPFKFYRDERRTVTVRVHYEADGSDVVAECSLSGARTLVGRDEPEETIHFTGRVRLRSEAPDAPRTRTVPPAAGEVVAASTIYDTYFHGPAYQVLEGAWGAEGVVAGRMADGLPANHEPAERPTLVAPRMVELAFQTAGLAEIADSERMGLPLGFRRLELAGEVNGEVESTAVVEATDDGSFDVDVANTDGQVVLSLRGYRTSALPGEVSGEAFGALRR
jgi:acyl transferase domain-containing protein/acyl carrier protein/NAD(P)-dependent dehydrogenase (short-subunit alcohol dehydrogenase family)